MLETLQERPPILVWQKSNKPGKVFHLNSQQQMIMVYEMISPSVGVCTAKYLAESLSKPPSRVCIYTVGF
jgi:hypothetical protein